MKVLFPFIVILASSAQTLSAQEAEPIKKVALAIAQADLVLGLIPQSTEADPLIDKMCLRLGRFSAILRRVRGSTPVPPENLRRNYVHYEHFCGWDPRATDAAVDNLLPRGTLDPSKNIPLLKAQLKADRDALELWKVQAEFDQQPDLGVDG